MKTIDLRSDTVTRPTPEMRAAIAAAEVGDDVYGEDPTVNRLQALAAARLGLPAAIFVPSGTMANQAALRALTQPGDVVLAGAACHALRYESGAAAALSGVHIQTIGSNGFFSADDVVAALPPRDHHYAPVSTVAIENTHNASGGRIFPFEQVRAVVTVAKERGLRLHLDGARLWNAVVASGIAAPAWVEGFDSVSFCLSKGLGAPAGSLVCGSAELIDRVHRVRKMLGGGMRQAGILAAAGLYAPRASHRAAGRRSRPCPPIGSRAHSARSRRRRAADQHGLLPRRRRWPAVGRVARTRGVDQSGRPALVSCRDPSKHSGRGHR